MEVHSLSKSLGEITPCTEETADPEAVTAQKLNPGVATTVFASTSLPLSFPEVGLNGSSLPTEKSLRIPVAESTTATATWEADRASHSTCCPSFGAETEISLRLAPVIGAKKIMELPAPIPNKPPSKNMLGGELVSVATLTSHSKPPPSKDQERTIPVLSTVTTVLVSLDTATALDPPSVEHTLRRQARLPLSMERAATKHESPAEVSKRSP
mmetsp:Transcript_16370/g.33732  ORF Transcript_16370/g.33732 Transcript_16370/m.33732 type:complete len:212 (+) Transcript_16370:2275-2910(+)